MGCHVSRLEANRAMLAARLRPLLLKRLEKIKARRLSRRLLKDSTPSKEDLLFHEEDNSSISSNCMAYSLEDIIKKPNGIEPEHPKNETSRKGLALAITMGNNCGMKVVVKEEKLTVNGTNNMKDSPIKDAKAKKKDAFGDTDKFDDADDDDNDNERMMGYRDEDDGAFPGSPSFRIYFKENQEDDHNEICQNDDAFKETVSTGDIFPSKEPCVEKKVKRGRKKGVFSKVLPKRGQATVKNLLNMKSCYSSPSHDHRRRIFTAKPPI